MTAGRSISKDELNNQAGGIAVSLFATLDNVRKLKAVLDGYSAQNLVDNFGFVLADANLLKSAVLDMDTLRQVWEGTSAKTPAADMRAFAKQLLGTGIY